MDAVLSSPQATQRWLAKATKPRNVRLDISPQSRADEVLDFRTAAGKLDPRCDGGTDAEADRTVASLSKSKRLGLAQCRPRAVTGIQDNGPAQLFVARPAIERLVCQRNESKAASRVPIAAFRAIAGNPVFIWTLTALVDVFFSIADLDEEVATVETIHLHKGKGKDAADVQSFRPLGLADPVLSLLVDVLHLRTILLLLAFVG